MAKGDNKARDRPIIIRREEVVETSSHGGAWKVAYADFVTALMAFFLLMWLVNATTFEQRTGLADYFAPSNALSHGRSGYGAPFGGHTPYDKGALASDRGAVQVTNVMAPPVLDVEEDDSDVPAQVLTYHDNGEAEKLTRRQQPKHPGGPVDKAAPKPGDDLQPGFVGGPSATDLQMRAELEKREKAAFQQAAQEIKDAVAHDPALADLARQLSVDITPEGLRIQMLDEEHQPMFATGSSALNDRARALLLKVTPVLMKLPEKLSIAGHTDAVPFHGGDRTNWELSAERANATRRLFTEAGLPESRVETVTGRADRDPLLPADPLAAANRRIAIVVLRDIPSVKPGM